MAGGRLMKTTNQLRISSITPIARRSLWYVLPRGRN
jgi:hypothetical protein